MARECTSTAGLAVLFAAVWLMLVAGQCEGGVALVAGTLLTAVGLFVAIMQRWRLMAHVAVALGLCNQLLTLGAGLGALRTGAGLSAVVAPLLLLLTGVRWVDVAASALCSAWAWLLALVVTALWTSGLSGGPLVVWGIAAAGVGGSGMLLSLVVLGRGGAAATLALSTAVGAAVCLAPLFGLCPRTLLIACALLAGFGVLYYFLDQERSWPGPLLALGGTSLGVLVVISAGQAGVVTLCAGATVVVAVALAFATARQSRTLAAFGWLGCVAQLAVLGLGHPAVAGAAGSPWAPTWPVWCAVASLVALQLGALGLLCDRSRLAGLTPAWIGVGWRTLAVVLAGAVGSTALHQLLDWAPLVTLVWAGSALLCFRLRRAAGWLGLVGGTAAVASLIKLIGWDWPQLGVAARFELLLAVGTLLLVAPLLGRQAASCPCTADVSQQAADQEPEDLLARQRARACAPRRADDR
jgi:hypothetical protein